MTSYSTLIQTVSHLVPFSSYSTFSSKVADFNAPHLHLSPQGVIPFEFRHNLWHRKTIVPGLTCGIICIILCLAVLIQNRGVIDRHTHDDGIYRASIASRRNNAWSSFNIRQMSGRNPCSRTLRDRSNRQCSF